MKIPNLHLANELMQMAAADQATRSRALQTGEWDPSTDQQNTARLKEILASHGWPTISGVGVEAASAAWLLAQHADHDPDFQASCLEDMKLLPSSEINPSNLAYLEDRVRVNTDRPQLYGTQFYREGDSFGPRPIEDEEHLDKRRLSVGLNPFADYKTEIEEIDRQHQQAIRSKN